MKRTSAMVAALSFILAASTGLAITPEVVTRGWKPSVEMAGGGNSALAVTNLRDIAELQKIVLSRTEFHQQTQQFLDELWLSLEAFNLNRFYNLLPETDGDWRQLKVFGARDGTYYRVGPDAEKIGVDLSGHAREMGDMSMLVRAKQLTAGDETHYLLNNTLELGIGQVSWPSLQLASAETLRVIVDGSPAFSSAAAQNAAQVYRDKVIRMNPELGREDIDIIAPLWASFPAMWDLLAQLGKIEDVVYYDMSQDYRQLNASFVLDTEVMKKHYPALASHVESMDRLFNGSIRLTDERGELLSMDLDSKTLRGHLQAFVANGRMVPVRGGRVVLDAPPVPDGQPWEFTAHMDTTVSILGVVTHMQNMKARVQYLSQPDGAKMVAQITEVPDISVKGSALGIMPTAMIDIVLPKDLNQIITDFIGVACKGNEGKGILVGAHFQQADKDGTAMLVVKSAFEGLDNFFVRFGMGIVSDRMIPDPKVSDEIRKLAFDTQEAFVRDLDGFAAIATL